jgi:hypothetical protein
MIQHELAQPLFSSKRFFRKSEDKSDRHKDTRLGRNKGQYHFLNLFTNLVAPMNTLSRLVQELVEN